MKIQIVSDIHLEFFKREQKIDSFVKKLYTNADVLILAGDISVVNDKLSRDYLVYFLDLICNHYSNIIYVLGNHEYYHGDFNTVLKQLKSLTYQHLNLRILENELLIIDDVIFYGTTLWFKETPQAILNTHYLNDFRYIDNFNPYIANEEAINYINNIKENDLKQVLVTHHLPTYKLVSEQYIREVTNCYYVCDIEDQLYKFDLVISGHSHTSVDLYIDQTRLVRNPYGYLQENKQFEFNKVIEI